MPMITAKRKWSDSPIIFELDPAATATGRVLDTLGEPISNVLIDALRRTFDVRGNPRLTRVAAALTDDRGEYRIFWLDPGNYFLYASSPPPPETSDSETPPPVAPTYYPDVNTPEDARTVRLELGRELLGRATACIDLSDGLALDLYRLAKASGMAAQIDRLPIARGATVERALHGGEDYELLFTVPPAHVGPRGTTRIGTILRGRPGEIRFQGHAIEPRGWDHFAV